MANWIHAWKKTNADKTKTNSFEIIDNYIDFTPTNILDIGCGLAFESEMFQNKYKSNLYLLDGDANTTLDRKRHNGFGSTSTMKFYCKIPDLKNSWDSRNMNYTFIDANDIQIDKGIKFDLIYSFMSCGFHYPISTYVDLLKKHSHKDTVSIFHIRKQKLQDTNQYRIIDILNNSHPSASTVSIKLK